MADTEKIRRRYDRISGIYDRFEGLMEGKSFKKWRLEATQDLRGKVLEVGIGTGQNIPYYPEDAYVTGIDFSGKMVERAKKRAERLKSHVEIIEMDAQNMSFPDNSFDMVFTTCVFCSVPDPIQGLKEIRRVCKDKGKIIMIEHVRSEKKLLGALMDIFNPVTVGLWGANINRQTVENIKEAGFTDIEVTNLAGDIVKKIVIKNEK